MCDFILRRSNKQGLGVFAARNLKKSQLLYTFAEIVDLYGFVGAQKDTCYCWADNGVICDMPKRFPVHKTIGLGQFVNEANTIQELNCIPLSHPLAPKKCELSVGEIVIPSIYVLIVDVPKGAELLTWYGVEYTRNYHVPDFTETFDSFYWKCKKHLRSVPLLNYRVRRNGCHLLSARPSHEFG